MLAHLSFSVADLTRSVDFYDATLAPLGYLRLWRTDRAAGYGIADGNDRLALFEVRDPLVAGPGFHLALQAPDRSAVDRFHEAALIAGGTNDGRPGLRPHYAETYYAAFIRDPDGWKLEAVHQ